ncbi:MAG: PBECR2 nuclease fold domain-containing protein [Bdellovibrionia bacterium]
MAKAAKPIEPDHAPAPARSQRAEVNPDACYHCARGLSGDQERALFVEEEVGRIFCSESCIAAYFTPEIERLEKEFFRRLTPSDLSPEERENLAHLRWITLQEPDEVWREKTLTGDYRYTLISEFKPGAKKIWSICICLFLRGEPSFLYLAFPTKNAAMANQYRRGEQVEWVRPAQSSAPVNGVDSEGQEGDSQSGEEKLDRLADSWTEDETVLAQLNKGRSKDDIPPADYGHYQACLEETLEAPDEVWSHESQGEEPTKLYHFIKHYPDEKPGVWFVIVARETDEEEQIEIIDAFPTRDSQLVEHYRRGEQEVGQLESKATPRVVH